MTGYIEIACLVFVLSAVWYYWNKFSFWKNRGVVGPRPLPIFGNGIDLMLGRISFAEYMQQYYNRYRNEEMIGLYLPGPALLLIDTERIKEVLIKNFSSFQDRGIGVFEKTDPMSLNLVNLEPTRWRPMRIKLNTAFTSGKMKQIFPLIVECTYVFEKRLAKLVDKGEPVNVRELCARYMMDVICLSAFGINIMSVEDDKNNQIVNVLNVSTNFNTEGHIRHKMRIFMPWLYKFVGYVFSEKVWSPFFLRMLRDTAKYRDENNIFRPDLLQTILDIRKYPESVPDIQLCDELLGAQLWVFMVAGYETSSTTVSNILYFLAHHHDVQDKVRAEIKKYCGKTSADMEYENISSMKYLDKVYKETLRLFPVVNTIQRRAVTDYTFSNSKITIPKNTLLYIPHYAIHRDPTFYPDPEKFDPERFNDNKVGSSKGIIYMPFGEGPRNCIGKRLGEKQTKVGVITILRNHKVDVCEKTKPYKFDLNHMLLAPIGGLYLKITRVED